jgi:hypothetical protein
MADLYVRNPQTGDVEVYDDADAQALSNAGFTALSQEEYDQARGARAAEVGADRAVSEGLVEAAPVEGVDLETGLSQSSQAFADIVASSATFGLAGGDDPYSRSLGQQFRAEHPGQAMAAEALGQLPGAVLGGAAGSAIRGAAAGGSALVRGGAFAADVGINAAIGGAQIEGEQARLAGENFSFTDAALAGVATETLGRGGAWAISKGLGGARNLLARAERTAVAGDAERSLSKGGWVQDYRVAQHADQYSNELADLASRDLDTLETAFAEVSRQDRKRARIQAVVVDNPAVQHEINVAAIEHLQRLRGALADELADASGPAKRLAKQLDDRIAALEAAPKGRKLWKTLDENRQALQEYRQDLYQAYDQNPGSAWLSREGLAAIDQAEEATRNALLREDAWGEAAARMQREYNVPFHEKWFPARQTVLKDLHFASGKTPEGFTTFRGEPGKMRKFLTTDRTAAPDVHRVREQFTQYLDGAEAIARAGERDAPKAARDALEAVRRLRKAMANADYITAAVARTGQREAVAGVAGQVAAGAAGFAAAGPAGAGGAFLAARGVRLGNWLGEAGKRLGLFRGKPLDMAALLKAGQLADAAPEEALAGKLVDDLLEGPFPVAPSARPPGLGGALAPDPVRGVGVTPARGPSTAPGVGQARRAAADRPAGMDALQPLPRAKDVGPAAPARTPDERPTLSDAVRTATARPEGEGVVLGGPSRATAADDAGSYAPPLSEVAYGEVTDPAARATTPSPFRAEKFAGAERVLSEGSVERGREAARLQALTEGEFRHVVEGLNATGARDEATGSLLGDLLAKHSDSLKQAGLIVAGGGAGALAASEDDQGQFAAAGAGLALLGGSRKLDASLLLGAQFRAAPLGKKKASAIVAKALEELPPPPAQAKAPYWGDVVSGKHPGIRKLVDVSAAATRQLDEAEQHAISEWVGTSDNIRFEQRTGLTKQKWTGRYAAAFESAMDKLTVLDPT